ncbi:MAG: hypothetical protein POELPBGB_00722 [Bacteroidia bacterium]|nr:hypothetical protein [Bacteroidia bacterium]
MQDIQQMANNTGQAISMALALFIALLGLCCSIIGLSGALSGDEMDNWIRGVLWVLAISGGMMLYGGVTMFFGAKKKIKDTTRDEQELAQAIKNPVNIDDAVKSVREQAEKPFADKNTLLAHWTYSDEEWKAFTKKEFNFRIREALVLWLILVGLGTWLLASYRDMGHLAAFISSLSIGGLITFIRFIIAYNALKANSSKPGDVVISAKSILINGTYHTLNDENKTLSKLELLQDENPQILEFTVVWNTRRGQTNEQVRVPVPSDKLSEAAKLMEVFNNDVIGKY